MREDLKRLAVLGSGVAELTKNRAEQMVKELIERSKENRKELARLVRAEVDARTEALGLARRRDLERLERRVARLEAQLKQAKPAARKKTTARGTE
jgi:polyhydroxyalkanoate synthesis regulator phasin